MFKDAKDLDGTGFMVGIWQPLLHKTTGNWDLMALESGKEVEGNSYAVKLLIAPDITCKLYFW